MICPWPIKCQSRNHHASILNPVNRFNSQEIVNLTRKMITFKKKHILLLSIRESLFVFPNCMNILNSLVNECTVHYLWIQIILGPPILLSN